MFLPRLPARPDQPLTQPSLTHSWLTPCSTIRRVNASCTAVLLHIASGTYAHAGKSHRRPLRECVTQRASPAAPPCTSSHPFCCSPAVCERKVKELVSECAIIVTFASEWQLCIKDEAALTSLHHLWPLCVCVFCWRQQLFVWLQTGDTQISSWNQSLFSLHCGLKVVLTHQQTHTVVWGACLRESVTVTLKS